MNQYLRYLNPKKLDDIVKTRQASFVVNKKSADTTYRYRIIQAMTGPVDQKSR
jgi:hypothetical protein